MAQVRSRYKLPGEVSVEDEQCIVCGATTTFCCSRCRRVYYCSQSCQRLDWRSHKLTCTESSVTPPPVGPSATAGLPSPKITLGAQVSLHELATETLKQSLMTRFVSMVGAYEWFDVNTSGYLDFDEFERTLVANGVTKTAVIKEMFTALDRQGAGKISLCKFLADAVKKLNPRDIGEPIGSPPVEAITTPPAEVLPSDPEALPAGRRALRAAAILAFRNGRYDDAIVSSLHALGITSPGLRWVSAIPRHPDSLTELLLLGKVFTVTKQLQKGEPFVKLIFDIFPPTSNFFPNHVLATLLCCVGELMDLYDQPSAGAYFDAYLDLTLKVFGQSSLVYGDALTVVSAFHFRRAALDHALTLSDRAKKIRKENINPPHARLADAYNNRGIILKALQRFKEAIPELKEAAGQRVKLFGVNSLPVADVFFTLASCGEEPEKYFSACHSVRLKLLGPTHTDTLAVASELKKLGVGRAPDTVIDKKELQELLPAEKENAKPVSPRLSLGLPPSVSNDPRLDSLVIKPGRQRPSQSSKFVKPQIKSREKPEERREETEDHENDVSEDDEADKVEQDHEDDSEHDDDEEEGISATNRSLLVSSPKVASMRVEPTVPKPIPRSPSMKLPESPFAKSHASLGEPNFVENLLTLDEKVVEESGFDIQKALPKRPPAFWIPIAMETVYAKKLIKEESDPEGEGILIHSFFQGLMNAERELRLVFQLLNGIFANIHGQKSGLFRRAPKQGLNVNNFVEFLHSRTKNVGLMEYFSEMLKDRHPVTYTKIVKDLEPVMELENTLLAKYLVKLEAEKKSIVFIQAEISKIPRESIGPTEEGKVVNEAITLLPEINKIKNVIVERSKLVSKGVALITELFGIKKVNDELDLAIGCLDELQLSLEEGGLPDPNKPAASNHLDNINYDDDEDEHDYNNYDDFSDDVSREEDNNDDDEKPIEDQDERPAVRKPLKSSESKIFID